jgi:hypothetical protein
MQEFRVDLSARARADVYLACNGWDEDTASIVKRMDDAGLRVVGDVTGLTPDEDRIRRILRGCSGLICAGRQADSLLRLAGVPEMPVFESPDAGLVANGALFPPQADSIDAFVAAVLQAPPRIREYAFYIGRLERDFTQAREAIRSAIENEAGVPFLWVDDGRHRTNVESIRERTRLLLQHASFVIADLTLGAESPDRENPSRAHEIGLALAYNRPLLLLSQEPRRYTYFSINDLQTIFWSTEDDLHKKVREWAGSFRDAIGRTTWNYRLALHGTAPKIAPLPFEYNPEQRYIGPKTPRATRPRQFAAVIAAVVIMLITLAMVLTKGHD